jgi:hypothetical protein
LSNDELILTIDQDWASKESMQYLIRLLAENFSNEKQLKFFITNECKEIEILEKSFSNIKFGIHPNFDFESFHIKQWKRIFVSKFPFTNKNRKDYFRLMNSQIHGHTLETVFDSLNWVKTDIMRTHKLIISTDILNYAIKKNITEDYSIFTLFEPTTIIRYNNEGKTIKRFSYSFEDSLINNFDSAESVVKILKDIHSDYPLIINFHPDTIYNNSITKNLFNYYLSKRI